MAAIGDDLNAIDVTVTSPDGRIEGRAESLKYITMRFLYDSYESYYRDRGPELLAHQLGRGATLLAAAYQKARRQVMHAHSFERYSAVRPPDSPRHREYLERGAKLTARGSSPDQKIQVTTVALIDFQVTIAPRVLFDHDEQAFMQLAHGAMNDLRQDYERAHTELRHELYQKYKDRAR
jgi:hypothetical protein